MRRRSLLRLVAAATVTAFIGVGCADNHPPASPSPQDENENEKDENEQESGGDD